MLFVETEVDKRRRELRNTLANIQNTLHIMLNKPCSWDDQIKAIQEINKLTPVIIRYMIYFKNKEKSL